ncbi:hemerythrin domain-containing protein [Variovorax sp. J22P168]|uniref:hemerythrin domain-containing protein n=1 Tax=Variovorax jilinensis TaxID=3053513 RepID=UPI002576D236|nr:hemerythrin domain-containing protein [Variovorax sp. J22P168]MDM0015185.1 hemerythrin domain-containing protein [Variovorax sp. J22P168]
MNQPIVLGHAEMDDVHAEFEELLSTAGVCSDQELLCTLDALIVHLESHFAMEDNWMSGGDFPPRDCHAAEHAAVLRSASEVRPLVAAGNFVIGRSFIRALGEWFPAHATHLDSALATWICKQRLGAKPLVFHRGVATH